jgi:Ca-activated chloride channel family protein
VKRKKLYFTFHVLRFTFHDLTMRFASPYYLWLLVVIPLAVVFSLRGRRARGALVYSDANVFGAAGRTRFSPWWTLKALRVLALVVAVLALARPQASRTVTETAAEGIDIVLAVDISTSMSAEDFRPLNRLNVAKHVVADFIRGRSTDRIGLILFAGRSFIRCPLTLDYEALLMLLKDVDLAVPEEDGTAIGLAVASSLNRLRDASTPPNRSRVIILLTDGVNNRGPIAPLDAATLAQRMQVKIYTIGVGSNQPARYLVQDPNGVKRYVTALVKIDEDTLKSIAALTGGQYFPATDGSSLSEIYKRIDALEKTRIVERRYVQHKDLYPYFLLVALALIAAEVVLANTILLKIP